MNITDIKEQLKEARRLRDNTSVKINDYTKKGKDTTDLEKQLQGLRARVSELTALEKLTKQNQMTRIHQAKSDKPEEVVKQITLNAVKKEAARVDREAKKHQIQVAEVPESAMIPKGEQKQLHEQAKKETKPVKKEVKSWTKAQLESCERTMNKILEDNDWAQGYQFRSSDWMFIKHLRTIVLPDSVELEYIIQYKTRNHRVEKTVTKYYNPDNIQSLNKYIEQVELWVMLNSGDMDNKDIPFGARFNQVQFEKQGFKENGWIIYK